ncbi:protein-export membrane protein SecD [Parafrankia colletiae]|uniref:Protein translocase subunit SecD n=1 Tax=Parafrankia colletiae TaxID=573497 RepID=A0A1S1R8H1_9ACTN|nr:protein translocase subunit SecD [Parafrankia colletiae]MCK9900805.1 protein translocase subunit SecD [Frankia sp. Cpl3]OHV43223.1 protein-export membrane protein SecD [Parafrankia colletiae]
MARRSARASGGISVGARLGALGALLAVLYGLMALTSTWTPKLGLDLQGGTSVILTPRSVTGGSVDDSALNKAVDVIRERVDGLGVAEAEVRRAGDTIEIAVPGRGRNDVVSLVGQTAELRFREVAGSDIAQSAAPATPAPGATPAPSGAPAPGATTTPGGTAPTGEAPTPAATGAPTPAASGAPASQQPAALGVPGSGSGFAAQPASFTSGSDGGPRIQLAAATGSSGTAAPGTAPTPGTAPAPSAAVTAPAAPASPAPAAPAAPSAGGADSPPADVAERYANLTCSATGVRSSTASLDRPEDWIAACDRDGTTKYLLKPAALVGTDVSSASAGLRGGGGTANVTTNEWAVNVEFTGAGQGKFTKLTEETVGTQVAIVLDGVVQSAPQTNERIAGSAEISGDFTQSEAEDLADVLRFGALPLAFERSQAESVSPTLGQESLHGGLLAGAIGLGLVVIYSFLYYRALGVVVVTSLAASAALNYAAVVLLGDAIGFTLTLAGIAGLIVSIGVTADSFVVYFERIKDEVRAGRSIRTAVDRAWPASRRTMLSADTVSFLAAAVLYILSVGSVRGFAFTLGLSTLVDVLIMFIFTRPLVTVLVRRPLFSTSRFSGLSASSTGGTGARSARLVKRGPATAVGEAGTAPGGDGDLPGEGDSGPPGSVPQLRKPAARPGSGRRTAGQRREH